MPQHHPSSPLVFLTLLLSLLLISACSDDSNSSRDVTSTSNNTNATNNPANNLANNPANNPDTCAVGAPCPNSAEICDPSTLTCTPACTENSCGLGMLCDGSSGLCVAGEACDASTPCSDESMVCDGCRGVCVDSDGHSACPNGDINCLTGEYCNDCTQLCLPQPGLCEPCSNSSECGESADLCLDIPSAGGRFCSTTCTSNLSCPEGYDCPAELGQCVPASGNCSEPAACSEDQDCRGSNIICKRGRCVPGCDGPGSCAAPNVCQAGQCIDACPGRACGAGEICDAASGVCKIEGQCLSSSDCPELGTHCDLENQQCVPGCADDSDCIAAEVCEDALCVERGCTRANQCAFGQVCEETTSHCEVAVGPYCDVCDPDNNTCGDGNECIELQDENEQSLGSFCFVACAADPNNRCPQGYQCYPLQDADGNPAGEVCGRECNIDPWE